MNKKRETEKKAPLILVVDDIPSNCKLIAHVLKAGINCSVEVASDGKEALKKAEELNPDLILLDVVMPGIDGYETCRQLKQNEKTNDIPVIFLTAKTDTEEIIEGFDCGAVDYVAKPIKNRELLARVGTHIRLNEALNEQKMLNEELQKSLAEIKTLSGLLPICSYCKNIRDSNGYWNQLEEYISSHTDSRFSHGICDKCMKEHFPQVASKNADNEPDKKN